MGRADNMDQILANLAESVEDTLSDVAQDDAELAGEITDVINVLDCVTDPPESIKTFSPPPLNTDLRIEKCVERQSYLESRYRNLQMRINRLRAQKLSCNARDVMGSVVTSCDRRFNSSKSVTSDKLEEPDKIVEAVSEKKSVRGQENVGKDEADDALGQIHNQLRHVQVYLDPEATESSSGGESGDELDSYPTGAELYAPLEERAKYRWLARRAQLASQWVWLQAQVSDLEYKIRQHTDLYRSQRASKGSVQLGEETISWPTHAKVAQMSGSGDHGVPLSCPVPSRVYGLSRDDSSDQSTDDEATMTCCRVRPVKRVRRRKLVDTFGLHHHVARAAKLSLVSCQCLRPSQWCVLCLGRRSHSVSVSSHDRSKARRKENVAILDHSYHAVLSHKADTQLGLVLMESLANRRWLVRHTSSGGMVPGTLSHLSKIINIKETTDSKENSIKDSDNKRKYMKRKDKNGKIIRRKRKFDDDSRAGSPDISGGPVLSVKDGSGVEKIRDRLSGDHKKKRKSSYDIDHIVIPMSMAATTRIDKIKYKEILTPSWREVKRTGDEDEHVTIKVEVEIKKEEPEDNTEMDDSEFEDISDLAYKLRHVKAEDEERIRWATPLGRTHGGQRGHHGVSRRRTRRLDSCRTEASSGANTPNPLSPEAIEDIVVSTRPSSPGPDALDSPSLDVSSPPAGDLQMRPPCLTWRQVSETVGGHPVRQKAEIVSQLPGVGIGTFQKQVKNLADLAVHGQIDLIQLRMHSHGHCPGRNDLFLSLMNKSKNWSLRTQ